MTEERVVQLGAAVLLVVLVVVGVVLEGGSAPAVLAGIVAAALGAALAARPWPARVTVAGLLVTAVAVHVVCAGDAANLGWFAVCVLAGWAGLAAAPVVAVPVGVVLAGSFLWPWLVLGGEAGWGAWIAGTLLTTVACVGARRQRLLLDQLHAAQADLADAARDQERARIARELHDVIGHALTVSLLHVSSARLALGEDPTASGEAETSLEEAERLSRRSLEEVRAVVGLMQRGAGGAGVAPASALPGTESLEGLVTSYRRAGTDVDWAVDGDVAALTATAGLTVYRILQEALTNAVRHAPGAPVTARLEVDRAQARLVVTNPAPVRVPTVDPAGTVGTVGTGVAGMAARAVALGGRVEAGPVGGDWRVEAVLPR